MGFIDNLSIELNRPELMYNSGELLQGNISFQAKKNVSISDFDVFLFGYRKTGW